MDGIAEVLPQRIKMVRKQEKLTQDEFAKSLGVSLAVISSYERGTNTPPLNVLYNISKRYNVSLDWLCGSSERKRLRKLETYGDAIEALFSLLASDIVQYVEATPTDLNLRNDNLISFLTTATLRRFVEEWDALASIKNFEHSRNLRISWAINQIRNLSIMPLENDKLTLNQDA